MLARENEVPFYVAAPISTLDINTSVENPAFDVTPSRYVSAIITERGVARAPYHESLCKLCAR